MISAHDLENEVQGILDLLERYISSNSQKLLVGGSVSESELDFQRFKMSYQKGEPLIREMLNFSPLALNHVARMLRIREGVVSRRVSTALGSSRANGYMGLLLASLALLGVVAGFKTIFPGLSSWIYAVMFVTMFLMVIYAGSGVLSAAHGVSRLLYYAELLEAAAKLKEGGIERPSMPGHEAHPVIQQG